MARLSFFDANCIYGKVNQPTPATVTTLTGMLEDMDYSGVDEALVCHAAAVEWSVPEGNATVVRDAKAHPRLHPSWVIPVHDLRDSNKVVDEMLGQGVKVARMVPTSYEGFQLEDWSMGPTFRALEAHRVPLLLTQTSLGRYPDGKLLGFSAQNIYDICKRHPNLPVVILRLNWSATRLIVPMLQQLSNLHVEISYYTAHRGVEFLAGVAGAERILFGSGYPWGPPGPGLAATRYSGLTMEQQQLIAGDNLRRLMKEVR